MTNINKKLIRRHIETKWYKIETIWRQRNTYFIDFYINRTNQIWTTLSAWTMPGILFRGDPNYESQSYSKKPEEKTQVDNLI